MAEKVKTIVDLCLTDPWFAKHYKYYWVIKNTFIPHQEKGPAYETHNGDTFWMRDGKYFRFDGDPEDIVGKPQKIKLSKKLKTKSEKLSLEEDDNEDIDPSEEEA